eukprot:g145.t1
MDDSDTDTPSPREDERVEENNEDSTNNREGESTDQSSDMDEEGTSNVRVNNNNDRTSALDDEEEEELQLLEQKLEVDRRLALEEERRMERQNRIHYNQTQLRQLKGVPRDLYRQWRDRKEKWSAMRIQRTWKSSRQRRDDQRWEAEKQRAYENNQGDERIETRSGSHQKHASGIVEELRRKSTLPFYRTKTKLLQRLRRDLNLESLGKGVQAPEKAMAYKDYIFHLYANEDEMSEHKIGSLHETMSKHLTRLRDKEHHILRREHNEGSTKKRAPVDHLVLGSLRQRILERVNERHREVKQEYQDRQLLSKLTNNKETDGNKPGESRAARREHLLGDEALHKAIHMRYEKLMVGQDAVERSLEQWHSGALSRLYTRDHCRQLRTRIMNNIDELRRSEKVAREEDERDFAQRVLSEESPHVIDRALRRHHRMQSLYDEKYLQEKRIEATTETNKNAVTMANESLQERKKWWKVGNHDLREMQKALSWPFQSWQPEKIHALSAHQSEWRTNQSMFDKMKREGTSAVATRGVLNQQGDDTLGPSGGTGRLTFAALSDPAFGDACELILGWLHRNNHQEVTGYAKSVDSTSVLNELKLNLESLDKRNHGMLSLEALENCLPITEIFANALRPDLEEALVRHTRRVRSAANSREAPNPTKKIFLRWKMVLDGLRYHARRFDAQVQNAALDSARSGDSGNSLSTSASNSTVLNQAFLSSSPFRTGQGGESEWKQEHIDFREILATIEGERRRRQVNKRRAGEGDDSKSSYGLRSEADGENDNSKETSTKKSEMNRQPPHFFLTSSDLHGQGCWSKSSKKASELWLKYALGSVAEDVEAKDLIAQSERMGSKLANVESVSDTKIGDTVDTMLQGHRLLRRLKNEQLAMEILKRETLEKGRKKSAKVIQGRVRKFQRKKRNMFAEEDNRFDEEEDVREEQLNGPLAEQLRILQEDLKEMKAVVMQTFGKKDGVPIAVEEKEERDAIDPLLEEAIAKEVGTSILPMEDEAMIPTSASGKSGKKSSPKKKRKKKRGSPDRRRMSCLGPVFNAEEEASKERIREREEL